LPGVAYSKCRFSPILEASLADLIRSVKAQGLEGSSPKNETASTSQASVPAHGKRCESIGAKKLVIGGYTPGTRGFDALVIGYCENGKLLFAARTRNGFTPVLRSQIYERFSKLEIDSCRFANLPENTRVAGVRA